MCLVITCQEYAFPSTVEPHTIDGVKSFWFFLVVCLLCAEEEGNTGGFCGVEGHDQLII